MNDLLPSMKEQQQQLKPHTAQTVVWVYLSKKRERQCNLITTALTVIE